jgi:hypothetical protein
LHQNTHGSLGVNILLQEKIQKKLFDNFILTK